MKSNRIITKSQQPLGLVLSFYSTLSNQVYGHQSRVSTAAWACIEFLPMDIVQKNIQAKETSTAAWACIEFLRTEFQAEVIQRFNTSQQPLGLALSFYSFRARILYCAFDVPTAAWACIEFLQKICLVMYWNVFRKSQQPLGLALSFLPTTLRRKCWQRQ